MMMPGEQNPHCDAPVAMNALAHWALACVERPAGVVTTLPASRSAG